MTIPKGEAADMIEPIRAVFREGAFHPVTPCLVPENKEVNFIVQPLSGALEPPTVTDPEERKAILRRVTERMMNNPIPASAPRFTREELHERR